MQKQVKSLRDLTLDYIAKNFDTDSLFDEYEYLHRTANVPNLVFMQSIVNNEITVVDTIDCAPMQKRMLADDLFFTNYADKTPPEELRKHARFIVKYGNSGQIYGHRVHHDGLYELIIVVCLSTRSSEMILSRALWNGTRVVLLKTKQSNEKESTIRSRAIPGVSYVRPDGSAIDNMELPKMDEVLFADIIYRSFGCGITALRSCMDDYELFPIKP